MLAFVSNFQEPAYVAAGFGEEIYHNATTLYPVGLAILLIASFLVFRLPRSWAILPLLAIQTLVPGSQRIVIVGLDFPFSRILIVLGIARILSRGEHRWWRLQKLDRYFLAWCVASVVIYTLRRGSADAFIYKMGFTVDTLGIYCLARVWIRHGGDIDRIASAMVALVGLAAVLFLVEKTTQRNGYALVGGVSPYATVRDGVLRCMGPFQHPILAGTFWVGVLPWIASRLASRPRKRIGTVLGLVAVVVVILTTASSTPLLGMVVVGAGFVAYWLRAHMSIIRWGALATLASLHVVMTMPVWHLISRVSISSGSTGYHRYRLIDAAVNHWSDWFLLGTVSTAGWGFYLFDVTNQYVKEAVDGGIWGLGLFLAYTWAAFACVGRLWRFERRRKGGAMRAWGLGVSMFAQCVMFLGISISHGSQNLFIWLLPIGACGGLLQSATVRSQRRPVVPSVPADGQETKSSSGSQS